MVTKDELDFLWDLRGKLWKGIKIIEKIYKKEKEKKDEKR